MFLAQYRQDRFIDLERVAGIQVGKDKIEFFLGGGDVESLYMVCESFKGSFLNQLQAINDSAVSVEGHYQERKSQ